ncbi:MAG: D-glycero-beta-D-manno-heptose 1-phosphate adenylyltransferase [Armatimonadota bacterium]
MPRSTAQKLVSREQLSSLGDRLRAEGRRVVFTNGCFDLLHVGHLRYLAQARELGDALVVGVNTDAGVRRLKGPSRPLVSEEERAELLAGLECVDWVTLFDEPTPVATIAALRPHLHVKGGDYRPDDLPEAEVVRSYGGEIAIMPLVPGRSTTSLAEKIRETGENEQK